MSSINLSKALGNSLPCWQGKVAEVGMGRNIIEVKGVRDEGLRVVLL